MTLRLAVAILAVVAGAAQTGSAQWLHHPTPGTPRLPDGKPNLSARAPRVSGKPDLSGVWQAEGAPIPELIRLLPGPGGENGLGEDIPAKYFINILADFKSEDDALLPSAPRRPNAVLNARPDDPGLNCWPAGLPMADLVPAPFKIVQTPRLMMVLYEADTTFRQIFVDGRKHPDDPNPSWMGYSIGKWDGDTFVVDTIGFNDRSWLDGVGHTHSDALHIVERFTRRSLGRMTIEMTLEDPKTFVRPITVTFGLRLLPDTDLIESHCSENEKDSAHMAVRQ
jgi:hypothetical protein